MAGRELIFIGRNLPKDLMRQAATLVIPAAWNDRMESLRNRPCRFLMEHLERDGRLDGGWQTEEAADFFWMLLSIQTWEKPDHGAWLVDRTIRNETARDD